MNEYINQVQQTLDAGFELLKQLRIEAARHHDGVVIVEGAVAAAIDEMSEQQRRLRALDERVTGGVA